LLAREGLFPKVAAQIEADLDKLRPYRILELLAQPEANVAERQQGLQLLQEILLERRGIDGTGNDGSGLSVEDFLRFIQQLRSYLTAAEQQSLFEAESQRPSAVATYLAVYALVARGFAERQPGSILQAKQMLMDLGKRQDLYLEQAICSLLLGQTTAASLALERSQEYEPLAFIRENSQDSHDMLPGLCLYSESWLQNEVFPHFRDLAQEQASLKAYFADKQVQAYLEALPAELDAEERLLVEPQQPQQLAASPDRPHQSSNRALTSQSRANRQQEQQSSKAIARRGREAEEQRSQGELSHTHSPLVATGSHSPLAIGTAVLLEKESATRTATNQNPTDPTLSQVQFSPQQRSRRRTKNRSARKANGSRRGEPPSFPRRNRSALAGNVRAEQNKRLVLLLASSAIGIFILWFLASQVYGLFKRTFLVTPPVAEQLFVELNQPPIAIPQPKSQKPAVAELLDRATATRVIQSWLSAKSAAFSRDRAVNRLEQVLAAPVLSQWQQRVQDDKANNRYRQYKHSIKVNSVQAKASTKDRAQVDATVNETAQVYERGRLNRAISYNEAVRVQYDLVRQNGQWRIQAMKVLN
jgi:hypothetical protein